MKNLVIVLLLSALLAGCKSKSATTATVMPIDTMKPASPVIADPTPPLPPNSVEISATDINNFPAFMMLAMGGVANEGEKENLVMDENVRLFQTDASAADLLSFYDREMRDRGWVPDGPVAKGQHIGLAMQLYNLRDGQVTVLIISEPEDVNSTKPVDSRRHILLMHGKKKSA